MVSSVTSSSTSTQTVNTSSSASLGGSASTGTSASSTTSSNASASAAAKSIVNKLGGGSGIDTASLAQSLVDATRAPRADAINKNISKNQATISGYAAVKYALTNLQTAFSNLKDRSSFNNLTANYNQGAAYSLAVTASADPGTHSISIANVASAQRSLSGQLFSSSSDALTGLSKLTLTVGGAAQGDISITDASPAGVVSAINNAGKGLTAALVNTGNGYRLSITGQTGASNAFTITPDVGTDVLNLNGVPNPPQPATDASLTVDGIAITSSRNSLTDVIPGITLNLTAPTVGQDTLTITNDTSTAKSNILALVAAYNDATSLITETANAKSTLATYGGTLVGNSSVRSIKDQLRQLVTGDSSSAGSAGGLSALRDIGIEVDSTGKLTSNSVKLDMALQTNFKNTVMLLSGNQQDQTSLDTAPSGLAGDASKAIAAMLGASGTLTTETNNANDRISKYKDDLAALDDRMSRLLDSYTKQFAAMDSMVGQTKAQQTGLTSTFAGMMSMYTNK